MEADGFRRLCCASSQVGKTGFDDPAEARKVRLQMLRGQRPEACNHCAEIEEIGAVQSYRQSVLNNEDEITYEQARAITKSGGRVDIPPRTYEFRITDDCNLACVTCYPGNSTGWYKDWYELHGGDFVTHEGRNVQIQKSGSKYSLPVMPDRWEWIKDRNTWPKVLGMLQKSIEYHGDCVLIIQGGEPLLQPEHQEFLKYLIAEGTTSVRLRYTTNLTTISPRIVELWKQFKGVEVMGSVDGVGKVNDYIRYPSKFSVIDKNIQRFRDLGVEPFIMNTVSTYSILYVDRLVEWVRENDFNLVSHFAWFPYESPFSPFVMPKQFIDVAIAKLRSIGPLPERLENVTAVLEAWEPKVDKSKDFWEYTRKLDAIRGHRIDDFLPELCEILHE